MSTLYELTQDALDELRDWVKYNPGEDASDFIAETADSSTPIMNYNLLQMASDNLWLAVTEPEIGPAFDGTPTPVNIIAANIYEHINQALWEVWESIKDEVET